MSRSCPLSAATIALLLLPAACSSAGGPTGAGPATPLSATRASTVASPAPSAARPERPAPRAASPLSTLNQMVTAQALLVSLLLAPVSNGASTSAVPAARSN